MVDGDEWILPISAQIVLIIANWTRNEVTLEKILSFNKHTLVFFVNSTVCDRVTSLHVQLVDL